MPAPPDPDLTVHAKVSSFFDAQSNTIGAQKEENIHVGGGTCRDDFIRMRTERDAQLSMPALIIPALQVNIRAGSVPKDDDGNLSLKVPLNRL